MDAKTRRSLLLSIVRDEWAEGRDSRTEDILQAAERMLIVAAVERTKFQVDAANYLGISSVAINRKIRRHNERKVCD